MLAVVYETFIRIEKDKFRKLYIHRRRACKHAFRLLVTKSTPTRISFKHYEGLMKYYKPSACKLDTYLMFKTLNKDKSGYLSLSEFYKVFEVTQLSWERKHPDTPWYVDIGSRCFMLTCQTIHDFVEHKCFNVFVYIMIASSGLWQVIEAIWNSNITASNELQMIETSPITLLFVTLYGIEASLKVIGFGVYHYFKSGWNVFDFVVTILAIIGLIGEGFGMPFSFVFVLRSLRLLRLFELKARYRDIMGTFLFIIMKRFSSVSIVVLIVYYFFAILGMELFSKFDMMNCCKNTSVEQYYAFSPNDSVNGEYYLNNFNDMAISYGEL
jgi:two pore calcium channel protein 1